MPGRLHVHQKVMRSEIVKRKLDLEEIVFQLPNHTLGLCESHLCNGKNLLIVHDEIDEIEKKIMHARKSTMVVSLIFVGALLASITAQVVFLFVSSVPPKTPMLLTGWAIMMVLAFIFLYYFFQPEILTRRLQKLAQEYVEDLERIKIEIEPLMLPQNTVATSPPQLKNLLFDLLSEIKKTEAALEVALQGRDADKISSVRIKEKQLKKTEERIRELVYNLELWASMPSRNVMYDEVSIS